MPDEGIGTRVSILGDKEYKAALSDINRSLAVLNSSMDASQSAFKGQESSMEALRDRSQRLQAVYDAQKQKTELIAAQLAKAKQEYGENSKQADALQIALNRATKQMNLTGAEIDKTNAAMEEAGNAGSEMTQGVQDAGKAVQDEGKQAKAAEGENSKLKEAMGKAGEVAEKALAAGCCGGGCKGCFRHGAGGRHLCGRPSDAIHTDGHQREELARMELRQQFR